jgi:hypothetical protein
MGKAPEQTKGESNGEAAMAQQENASLLLLCAFSRRFGSPQKFDFFLQHPPDQLLASLNL